MPLDKQGPSFSRRGFRTKQADEEEKTRNISPGGEKLLDRIQAVLPRFVAETNCSFFPRWTLAIIASLVEKRSREGRKMGSEEGGRTKEREKEGGVDERSVLASGSRPRADINIAE